MQKAGNTRSVGNKGGTQEGFNSTLVVTKCVYEYGKKLGAQGLRGVGTGLGPLQDVFGQETSRLSRPHPHGMVTSLAMNK